MIKPIVKDPIFLRIRSVPADASDLQTAQDLLDTLKANSDHCVGLAANMIGVNKTILAAFISGKPVIMINPEIISHSDECYETEEGCLSLNGTRTTSRYKKITVKYYDMNMKKKTGTFSNFEAQIIQHETDHFSGILI